MPDSKQRLQPRSAWVEAGDFVWANRGRLAVGLILTLLNRLVSFVHPAAFKYLIDDAIGGRRAELLVPLGVIVGVAACVNASTTFALSQLLGVAAQRSTAEMRKAVQAHIVRLPLSYFDSARSGELVSQVMRDTEAIQTFAGGTFVRLLSEAVMAIIALAVLFSINWKLTTIGLVVLAAFAFGMSLSLKRLRPLFRERAAITAEIAGRLFESFAGIRIVKAYAAEPHEDRVFKRGIQKQLHTIVRLVTTAATMTTTTTLVTGSVGIITILVGGRGVASGVMTLGEFVMCVFCLALLVFPITRMSSVGVQFTEAIAGFDRIHEITRMATDPESDDGRKPCGILVGEVIFEDVTFEYKKGTTVLKHLSFRAAPGTTTAVVGSSGSGKSTLITLIMSLRRPTGGRILVDGHDLETTRLNDYRTQLGVVLQDDFVFDGTITDNISLSRPGASFDDIKAAAVLSHCDRFIDTLPMKYETVVGERGVRLSGGQRQRIAVARAMLADPRILILDEATSSLDSESEAMILDALRTLRKGRTTFVIAHRLSTIQRRDQILVLESGEIVQRGTHDELMARCGRYRQLYDRQSLCHTSGSTTNN